MKRANSIGDHDFAGPPNKFTMVRKSEVPAYLHSGEFYMSLSDEDHEQISVPSYTLKMDTAINSNENLNHLLLSLRFWGVGTILQEIIDYCLSQQDPKQCSSILQEFIQDFPYVNALSQMLQSSDVTVRAKIAIQSGIMELVQAYEIECCTIIDGCEVAARAGHFRILQHLHSEGAMLNCSLFISALRGGSKSCVEYLHDQKVRWPADFLLRAVNGSWYSDVHDVASKENADIVHYAIKNGCLLPDKRSCKYAANHGALDILKYLHGAGVPLDEDICELAADRGDLACLQYAHSHGCPITSNTYARAAASGSLACLQYAHEQTGNWGTLAVMVCAAAAAKGLEHLQYAHTHGCRWDSETCSTAAANGRLDCLKYAHENGCPWSFHTTFHAAYYGHLDCLQYAVERGCEVRESAYTDAVKKHPECAEYLKVHVPALFAK